MTKSSKLPLLSLKDIVMFPGMALPIFVDRKRTINTVELTKANAIRLMIVTQKNCISKQCAAELYNIGCIGVIRQLLRLPDGTMKVMVEGVQRSEIISTRSNNFQCCEVIPFAYEYQTSNPRTIESLFRMVVNRFECYLHLNKRYSEEAELTLRMIGGFDLKEVNKLFDTIAISVVPGLKQKQRMLEAPTIEARLEILAERIEYEMSSLLLEDRLQDRIKHQMEKSQKEYFLHEQLKAIQKELGEPEELSDIDRVVGCIEASKMPEDVKAKAKRELRKLRTMAPSSADSNVIRSYIEVLISLPWKRKSVAQIDINKAEDLLNANHYGLSEVKSRVIEHLVISKRAGKARTPILCFVGPPGVGKTSLGRSIAKAIGRRFVRASLGGVHDEAEIRGHRRTYVGSMPGKILQSLIKVKVCNPLFLLDEVDKVGSDLRGDPASALLEVLDPEQNSFFCDHYIEVEFDLSDVMFIATANSLNIPKPLVDRMEVIKIPGYTEDEKANIAHAYLIKKHLINSGLKEGEVCFSKNAINEMIRYYTREPGVRSLEKEIAKICRKIARKALNLKESTHHVISSNNLKHYLGNPKYSITNSLKQGRIGQVAGLAWSESGGDLLFIEALILSGKGRILRTGSLGKVMKESIEAARSITRSRVCVVNLCAPISESDIHIHAPENAVPKDGPSAGVAVVVSIFSVLTDSIVRSEVAVTGEVTLNGEVLPIGGLTEKLYAAQRGNARTVLIPEDNLKELESMPNRSKLTINVVPIKWIDQALIIMLKTPQKLLKSFGVPTVTPSSYAHQTEY
ncbi:endopeptidase La [Candidatus Tremblaya phenacola]|uniref:endopeptidase La n=1 Tax=Candidatus Tremblayella phenacoccinincola TaxID=1010676 RepID=UPI001CF6EE42|nr:endopeptidase La [Candidatus Tremblaya phenacola]